jgi:2-enoate reductase
MRGHEVTLYEKSDQLGGHLIEASVPSFKEEMRDYLNWIIRQMAGNGVRVELNREVTPALVEKEKPEVIVVATGSSSYSPKIAGIDKPIVTSAVAVLLGKAISGDRPVVAGGGAVGSELALHLAQQGKKVTLVEMLPEIASDVTYIKNPLTVQLADAGVKVMTNTRITGITDGGVQAISDGKNLINVTGDRVILAMGMASDNKLYNTFRTMAKQVFLIGDGAEPRRLGEAIHEGYRVGSII